jgi:FkbM family methyltransferase
MAASSLKQFFRAVLTPQLLARFRMIRQGAAIRRFRARNVVHTYGGLPLTVHLADPLAAGWYDHDWLPLPELTLLGRHRLKPGATVFDLGAHQGIVALMLSHAVGPAGKVVALEANPHNARVAAINKDNNQAEQLIIEHAAAAERVGTMTFGAGLNAQADDGSGNWGEVSVRTESVDSLAARHGVPDVLFIDVEGYEQRVLEGGSATLATHPDCIIEMHVGEGLEKFGGSVAAIVALLADYELWMWTDARTTPLPFDADHPLTRARFFLLAVDGRSR